MLQLKILRAAAKTWLSQINKYFLKKKERRKEKLLKFCKNSENLWYLNKDPHYSSPFQLSEMNSTPDGHSQEYPVPPVGGIITQSEGYLPGKAGHQYFSSCPITRG